LWARHVLLLVIVILLLVRHWHCLTHVGGARDRVRQRGAASSLVWRVRELVHWTLILKGRSHGTAALVRSISEVTTGRGVAHIRLKLRGEISASASTLLKCATSRAWALIAHITVGRLRGLSTKMCGLIPRSKRTLGCRYLSHVTLTNISVRVQAAKKAVELTSPSPPRLPNVTPLPCCAKPDGGLPPLAAG
jgi:hypothetical protein